MVLTKSGIDLSTWRLPTPQSTPIGNVRKHLSDSRGRGGLAGASRAIEDTIAEVTAAVNKTFNSQSSEGQLKNGLAEFRTVVFGKYIAACTKSFAYVWIRCELCTSVSTGT